MGTLRVQQCPCWLFWCSDRFSGKKENYACIKMVCWEWYMYATYMSPHVLHQHQLSLRGGTQQFSNDYTASACVVSGCGLCWFVIPAMEPTRRVQPTRNLICVLCSCLFGGQSNRCLVKVPTKEACRLIQPSMHVREVWNPDQNILLDCKPQWT